MKNELRRYDTNRTRPRHDHKYTKYKMCLSMKTFMCNKQHLSNIGSWIHEKVKQNWGRVEKNLCFRKNRVFHMIIEEILLPTSIGYCKISDFFLWVIFLVSSPSSLTTMRFPYSSWINTSLGESSSFPVLSISIPSSFFSAITTVLEGLPFSMKPFFFLKIKLEK